MIYKCFLDEWKELRSFSHFQILTKIAYTNLSRNLIIDWFWSLSSFTATLWKSVKLIKFECQLDFSSVFLMNGTGLLSFRHFQIFTWIAYMDLQEKSSNWLIFGFSSFTVKLWKSAKMIKFQCKRDLQKFSCGTEQNSEVLVIFKFSLELHTRTLA